MITVTLYTRKECHLCEQAEQDLEALQDEIPHRLVVVDIDQSMDLQRAYGFEIPVVEVGPYKLKAPFDKTELRMTLGAARDRRAQLDELQDPQYAAVVKRSQTWTGADKFTSWFGQHYMLVFNLLVLLYVGLPVLAPLLMRAGIQGPANIIYRAYGTVCHQLAYRSFFLFGEQPFYPRAAAKVDVAYTFQQATGINEQSTPADLLAARSFVGTDQLGYKIALCERDVSIYGAILLFGVLFVLSGRRIPPLPWYLWILFGLVPIGIDGVSQLLSQPPFEFWALRESTPFLRTLTGGLFGFMTAWFGYPMVEETMAETRRIMALKRLRLRPDSSEPRVADQATDSL